MPKTKSKLPDMTDWSETEIHQFWKTHDSSDYWDEMEPVEVRARRSPSRAVAVKLEESDITKLKKIAEAMGIGHTTLIRIWVKEMLKKRPLSQK